MGLLDYYKQYEDMEESEVNRLLRERHARQKALAMEVVPLLDLSGTEWPDFPNADVISAAVYAARGRVNRYPDRHATRLRRTLAERHTIKSDQIVLGNGIAELLQTAVRLLAARDDELIGLCPSYPLFQAIAARAGARFVAVDLVDGHIDARGLLAAVGERTRVIVICNPNDPTGTYLESERLGELLSMLPDHVHVLLDEAYIQFQDAEEEDACLRLVEAFPRLLVFRTFSKVYGLSGLRIGYAVGSPASVSLLGGLAPVLGVNVLAQAAAAQALRIGDSELSRRRTTVIEQRQRLCDGLRRLPLTMPESQANFIWIRAHDLSGAELAARLEQSRVRVALGGPFGDDDHVRAAVRDSAATERLFWALRQVFERQD